MAAVSVLSRQLEAGSRQPMVVSGEGVSVASSLTPPSPATQLPALHLLQLLCSQPVHSDLCGEVVSLANQLWAWGFSQAEDEEVKGKPRREGGMI